jgi:hypothetical protein
VKNRNFTAEEITPGIAWFLVGDSIS